MTDEEKVKQYYPHAALRDHLVGWAVVSDGRKDESIMLSSLHSVSDHDSDIWREAAFHVEQLEKEGVHFG